MFADPEALVVAHLDPLGVVVSTRLPPTPVTDGVVRVMLTGTSRRSMAHRDCQITLECWSPDSPDAADLAELVRSRVETLDTPGGHVPQGPAGWVGGPYADDDALSGTPRYVMTVIVRQRRLT